MYIVAGAWQIQTLLFELFGVFFLQIFLKYFLDVEPTDMKGRLYYYPLLLLFLLWYQSKHFSQRQFL